MGKLGGGLRLAGESLADVLLKGELGRKDLDGHPALKPFVAGAVDHAHPSAPDLALDRISITQCLAQTGGERLIGRLAHRTNFALARPLSATFRFWLERTGAILAGPPAVRDNWRASACRDGPFGRFGAASALARQVQRQADSLVLDGQLRSGHRS